ncbi:MAG: hypothetical protein JNM17_27090 [Archangium sp.]|nr:hypothetical protein [Archangium sp.]
MAENQQSAPSTTAPAESSMQAPFKCTQCGFVSVAKLSPKTMGPAFFLNRARERLTKDANEFAALGKCPKCNDEHAQARANHKSALNATLVTRTLLEAVAVTTTLVFLAHAPLLIVLAGSLLAFGAFNYLDTAWQRDLDALVQVTPPNAELEVSEPPVRPPPPAPKPEPDSFMDWLIPGGVLVLGLLLAWKFVGNALALDSQRAVELDTTAQLVQFAISIGALGVIGWGLYRHWEGKSHLGQRLRDRLLLVLGLLGFLGYFNFGHLHFGNFVHVWDTYHYVMGAKYFPELGYEKLYDCTTVANYENGHTDEVARQTYTDLRTNIIIKTDEIIAHPERCKESFTPERWQAYRTDVAAFRAMVNEGRWREIHLDHGYNATPVWTLAGYALTNASGANVTMQQLTRLNLFDPLYLLLTVIMIYWAFGPRAFAIAAIVLGCHFPNRYYWTGGAFLRHDWIFWFVASICLLRKNKPELAGAAFAYTTLLRLFPGLAAAGVAVGALEYFRQNKKLDPRFTKYVIGGVVTTAVLVGASFAFFGGPTTWQRFAQNTVKHANTPLTNHMGLRTVLSWRPESIGQKTAGGYRKTLTATPDLRLQLDGDDEIYAPVDGDYTLVVRGSAASPVAYGVLVDGQPQGTPLDLGTSMLSLSSTLKLTRGEHKLALTPLSGGAPMPAFESVALNRLATLDGWWYWKVSRLENWQQAKPLMWLTFLAGMYLVWLALKNAGVDPWLGAAMGTGFIVIGAELTNYYYCFLMGIAVLHEKKREVGAILVALCAVSHWLNWGPNAWMSHWLDEQYVTMSLAALFAVFAIWWSFTRSASDAVAPEEPLPLLFGDPPPPQKLAIAGGGSVAANDAGGSGGGKKKKKKK